MVRREEFISRDLLMDLSMQLSRYSVYVVCVRGRGGGGLLRKCAGMGALLMVLRAQGAEAPPFAPLPPFPHIIPSPPPSLCRARDDCARDLSALRDLYPPVHRELAVLAMRCDILAIAYRKYVLPCSPGCSIPQLCSALLTWL